MALLRDILGCSSMDDGDPSPDWKNLFGDTEEATSWSSAAEGQTRENSFLPSQLLDNSFSDDLSSSGRTGLLLPLILLFSTSTSFTVTVGQSPSTSEWLKTCVFLPWFQIRGGHFLSVTHNKLNTHLVLTRTRLQLQLKVGLVPNYGSSCCPVLRAD